ncbi:hypothetical protein C9426_26780 [Serratia sp. S1B]|nr:hypothetical protein C9426_26780 [Serratia sp. S1B]
MKIRHNRIGFICTFRVQLTTGWITVVGGDLVGISPFLLQVLSCKPTKSVIIDIPVGHWKNRVDDDVLLLLSFSKLKRYRYHLGAKKEF